MDVLFVTPEIAPWIKSGGLGEVSHALPAALAAAGCDTRVLVPRYPALAAAFPDARLIASFPQPGGSLAAARLYETDWKPKLKLWLLDCPEYFDRAGGAYQDHEGRDFPDNAFRFGLLSRIAASLAGNRSPSSWRPQVVHLNDWMCALAAAYAHYDRGGAAPMLLGLHNVAFQGVFALALAEPLGLPAAARGLDGVEYFGQISFLKAGLQFADCLVAVSRRYAEEIQSEAFGYGLAGLLRWRRGDLAGIVNGIDSEAWNPQTDRHLVKRYGLRQLGAKTQNTAALRRELGLDAADDQPLIGMVSRLTPQKGIDLVCQAAAGIRKLPAQLVVLGQGDKPLEAALTAVAREHAGQIAVRLGFDEGLAHRIEAGADLFLMPSRFEPCGLNQMYSLRYGTPPVVHEVGGLADTVVDCREASLADGSANGFTFHEATVEAMLAALRRAVDAWRDRALWRRLQRAGMQAEHGWEAAARQYLALYQELTSRS